MKPKNFEEQIKILKEKAPYCSNMTELSRLSKISRPTMYRVFKEVITLKDTIHSLFGTNLQIDTDGEVIVQQKKNRSQVLGVHSDKQKVSKAKAETVTVTFQPSEQRKRPQTDEERIVLGRQICELVTRGSSTQQACEIVGIHFTTFYAWASAKSPKMIPEIRDEYELARNSFNMMMDEEIVMQGRQVLKTLLQDREITNVTQIGKVNESTGELIVEAVRHEKRTITPNMAVVRFVLEKLAQIQYGTPDERREAEDEGNDVPTYDALTLEELEREEARLKDELGLS